MNNWNRFKVFELEQELKKFRFAGYSPLNGVNFRREVIEGELKHRYWLLNQWYKSSGSVVSGGMK